jgi:histidine triad (HIT) family protein
MGECVFCDIVAKQAPASVVYEDDSTLGLMDLYPATIGHVIVIPKAHASNLAALPPGEEEKSALQCISRSSVRG